ncbi:hypothetical protein M378DRAFT_166268 [Amanita muscaria Koide BX008]|uniref:Uncharacterized protein n=1 Tax=Amanita muscaria (strain Koide BX008) TaxID=946122 RepID=A0A0C2WYM1_AMAMK|nr:hypothetical protein M378DRAFT_166268 [Amanita muscaria Koide BX008]
MRVTVVVDILVHIEGFGSIKTVRWTKFTWNGGMSSNSKSPIVTWLFFAGPNAMLKLAVKGNQDGICWR